MDLALTEPPHAQAGVKVVRAKDELRAILAAERAAGRSVGLVPTMGSLHEGHLSLLRAARAECDLVVMSLFVNPAQFGPGEDLERYPRDEQRDAELAAGAGVDLIYAPPVAEVYPEGFATAVEVRGLTEVLCGDPARRGPGHFRGVATVVAKLFNTVAPDVAYFGRKDAQQVAVIRRMVRDLDIPVRIEALPIVREPDGLAMSSRNAYLSAADRERATALHRAPARGRAGRPRGLAGRRPRGRAARARRRRDRARVPRGARAGKPGAGRRVGRRPGPGRGRRPGRRRAADRQPGNRLRRERERNHTRCRGRCSSPRSTGRR